MPNNPSVEEHPDLMGVEKFDEDEDFNESNLIHVRLPGRKVNTFKFLFPDISQILPTLLSVYNYGTL